MQRTNAATAASLLLALCAGASAAPWIEVLDEGFYVTDFSYDGTVAAGNVTGDGSYETFRWTRASGVVRLGQASVPVIGAGGGSPDVSYDGTKVSASILSSDYNLTLGLWSESDGWTEAFPPVPEYVGNLDSAYGSAWGLSGDGKDVVGYYYHEYDGKNHVQACSWSLPQTIVDYPSFRARANAASYNGSVVVGWEDSGLGPWFPMVWRDDTKYYISDALGSTQANSVNIDGSVVVGYGPDEYGGLQAATIWRWNGAGYDTAFAGYLPDTVYGWGAAWFSSVTDSGNIAVGANRFAFNPAQGVAAIIWTPETGLVSGEEYITSLGLTIPDNMELRDFQSISPDGSTIAAVGLRLDNFQYQTFLIHLHEPCPADMSGDWTVDDADFVIFADSYNVLDCSDPSMPLRCPADLNHDGIVDDTDFVLFAGAYDALLCP